VIAHLRPEKGHRTLLEAMPAVGNAFAAPPHLVVVGSGSEERALKERARTIRDTMVHFVGHQDDVAPWFALADVVAMPSYREPFGISAIEAMAGSRPLVASRVDGLIEVVEDGVSGLLVHPRDAGELASGLLRLLQHPDLAATIAANGYRRFRECFTIDGMVQMWRKCYEELVGDARLAERA
jgi:glycosyltransferase involved in cell wall biosynthesis